ncbi:ETC complex I subunit [Sphingosinicellaceae bacterium]|nr:ETC complex I subunit [Sphingosinicellaceae bacterium]
MKARIFQRPKSSMQSGKARTGQWVLVTEPAEPQHHDPLTGWIGSGDTRQQVELKFASREAAVAYAEAQGMTYDLVPLPPKVLKLQAYADNFR